jgi:hypothetical protein
MDTQPTQTPPQTPQPTPPTPENPTPVATPQPSATVQGADGPQASAYAAATPSTMALPTQEARTKNKRLGWILTIVMIAIIVGGLLFGYVLGLASIIGAYAVSLGIRYKLWGIVWTAGVIAGLNLALYILTIFVN